uniref:Uncharacterized protein n=1 Tax=Dulem virus 229 TaxID=3145706 RepID=A0AAU8B671_9VIRU
MIRPLKLKNCLNRFQAVPIPTVTKLFEMYGFSRAVTGHPDNTDPYNFTDPSNPSSDPLNELGRVNKAALRDAYASKSSDDLPPDKPDESDKSEED